MTEEALVTWLYAVTAARDEGGAPPGLTGVADEPVRLAENAGLAAVVGSLRRVDQGGVSDEQIEKLGLTLMALEKNMDELRVRFGLTEDDLNLDLGPLGPLLPRD